MIQYDSCEFNYRELNLVHTAIIIIAAIALDRFIGEPTRAHPLVIFGHFAERIERIFWKPSMLLLEGRFRGIIALLVILSVVLILFVCVRDAVNWVIGGEVLLSIVVVYACIASRSLIEHAQAIVKPLKKNDLNEARKKLSYIVSRDVQNATAQEIASATCESVLENGSDGIFSALFWFLIAGVPGILLYRAVNTLDAMWGYRTEQYTHFGWAAAKCDDVLNWIPARLVAFSYALMGQFDVAIRCWDKQASRWKSPNAGPVMAAGAGSLKIRIGGDATYNGYVQQRPVLGEGRLACVTDINRALDLIDRTLVFWVIAIVFIVL